MYNHLNIEKDRQYLCVLEDGTKFQGEVLDFSTTGRILMKSKSGDLFIKPYSQIKDMIEFNTTITYNVGDLLRVKEDCIFNNRFKLFKNEIVKIKSIYDDRLFLIKVIRSNKIKYSREMILDKDMLFNYIEKIQFNIGDTIDISNVSVDAIVGHLTDGYVTATVYKTRIKGEIYQIDENEVYVNNIFDELQYIILKSQLI